MTDKEWAAIDPGITQGRNIALAIGALMFAAMGAFIWWSW